MYYKNKTPLSLWNADDDKKLDGTRELLRRLILHGTSSYHAPKEETGFLSCVHIFMLIVRFGNSAECARTESTLPKRAARSVSSARRVAATNQRPSTLD